MRPARFALAPLFLAAAALAACALAAEGAKAAPLPPASGDWVLDTGEAVWVNGANLTVVGNLSLSAGSELHFTGSRLTLDDTAGKRVVFAPIGSTLTFEGSAVAAALGPARGGSGYYLRADGTLTMNASLVTGLSGPAVPNPLAETEGIHITNTASSITNSTVTGAQGYAISVSVETGTVAPLIADNLVQNSGGGIFLSGLFILRADARIERNTFSFNTLPHIAVTGSNPLIENNSFRGSTAGVTVFLGSPAILNNSFVANLLNAVSITQGGGRIEGNTVTATGIAFALVSSTVTVRDNTVTFSATGLQASGSTVTFDRNNVTGALAPALLLNGTTLTGAGNTLESAFGSPVVRATNASAVTLRGGSLASSGGPGVSADGGSVVLDGLALSAALSPFASTGTAVSLRNATLSGSSTDPVLALRGGSLAAAGGSISGGGDGVYLDGAASTFNGTTVHGNTGWGIHAAHLAPQLQGDEVGSFVYGNGQGDLLFEADLTVVVLNAQREPVANASVTIAASNGGSPLSGVTALDGRVGPVRLEVRRVDSLNNEFAAAPYTVRAAFGQSERGLGNATLAADEEVEVVLAPNSAPTGRIEGPETTGLFMLVELTANFTDADGDALNFSWSLDDGRTFQGQVIRLSFDAAGPRNATLRVSDGFEVLTLVKTINVLTPRQLDRPPVFTSDPVLSASLDAAYVYAAAVADPDLNDTVAVQLVEGPAGMSLVQSAPLRADLSWRPGLYFTRGAQPLDLSFNVTLRAWDGLLFAYQNFTLRLQSPPDLPPRIARIANISLSAGDLFTLDLTPFASDPDDPASSLTWSLAPANDTAGASITLDAARPWVLVVKAPAVISAPKAFTVRLEVRDPAGQTDSVEVAVELKAAQVAASTDGAALAPTLLSVAALGVALFALIGNRVKRERE